MTARDAALLELDRKQLPGWRAGILGPRPSPQLSDPRDRALAEQIIVGVVKNLLLLRHLTTHYSGRPPAGVDPLVQKILGVGLYQLRFLDRVPASAVVDEAVKQAKRFGLARASGFVNAVLRNATRDPSPPLPTPQSDPREYARVVLSHPPELFTRLAALRGTDEALAFCLHDNAEPPTVVRLLPGATPDHLATDGVEVIPHERPGMLVIRGGRQPLFAEWARRGVAQVQDPTAAGVVDWLDVRAGQRVLDRCCGMGTKTMQLRERVGDAGAVVAVDPAADRCAALRRLVDERRLANVTVLETGMLGPVTERGGLRFDRILIDAPCSNSGVLARRPEARYAQGRKEMSSLHALQDRILADAAHWLAPGGLLVYSTCSVWPEENESRVAEFVSSRPDYERLNEAVTWPSTVTSPDRYHDGGFRALLRRRGS